MRALPAGLLILAALVEGHPWPSPFLGVRPDGKSACSMWYTNSTALIRWLISHMIMDRGLRFLLDAEEEATQAPSRQLCLHYGQMPLGPVDDPVFVHLEPQITGWSQMPASVKRADPVLPRQEQQRQNHHIVTASLADQRFDPASGWMPCILFTPACKNSTPCNTSGCHMDCCRVWCPSERLPNARQWMVVPTRESCDCERFQSTVAMPCAPCAFL